MGEGLFPKQYFPVKGLLVSREFLCYEPHWSPRPSSGHWAEILDSQDRLKSVLEAVCCF